MMIFHKLFCFFGMCLCCRQYTSDDHLGGVCVNCGKIHGLIDRFVVRQYLDLKNKEGDK